MPESAERLDRRTTTHNRPDHPVVLSILRAIWAEVHRLQGRDANEERRRAEWHQRATGALMPPESKALGLVVRG